MKKIALVYLMLISVLLVNGQEGCYIKPAKFDKIPFYTNERLVSDRFYHTINPDIIKQKTWQLESALFMRDLFLKSMDNGNKTETFNIYQSHKIKYAIIQNVEFQLTFNDIVFWSGREIKDFGGDNPYLRTSIGVKYLVLNSENGRSILGLYAQIGLPNLQKTLNYLPELRVLYSYKLTDNFQLNLNIGDICIDKQYNTIIYGIETRLFLTKRMVLFAEHFKNYTEYGSSMDVKKRLLLGIGYYMNESNYIYFSYEKGWDTSDLLYLGKLDIGFTHRF